MSKEISQTTKELMDILPKYAPNDFFVKGTLLMVKLEEERKILLDTIKSNPDITTTEISYLTVLLRRKRNDPNMYED